MEIWLNEKQKELKEFTRKVALEKILPKRKYYDENEEFPWEIVKELSSAGFFEVIIPKEYGGRGGGLTEMCVITEELSRTCGGIALSFAGTVLGINPILLFGSKEQKSKYLPSVAKGEKLAAFGLTEANAGSDASSIKAQAKPVEGGYVLNGTKQWITNGGEAEIYTIVAITDKSKGPRGASAFIVEKGIAGFTFGKKENKMGIRASSTRELVFNDCFIPKENLLGREGSGFIIAMKTFDKTRPGVAAQALGIAQGAFDEALDYSKRRKQFDRSICSFQDVMFKLSDMATQIEAARSLIYSVAALIDSGAGKISKESSMAKVFASDVAVKVTTAALQIFGGYGYLRDYPAEKMMRDAKITQIYEGTNEIQRNIIALKLIKESASQY